MPPKKPVPSPEQQPNRLDIIDLIELGVTPFESIIRELERACPGPGRIPGTRIQRVLLNNRTAQSYGMERIPALDLDGQSPAWCLALGLPGEKPTHTFYGWTLLEAVQRAVAAVLK